MFQDRVEFGYFKGFAQGTCDADRGPVRLTMRCRLGVGEITRHDDGNELPVHGFDSVEKVIRSSAGHIGVDEKAAFTVRHLGKQTERLVMGFRRRNIRIPRTTQTVRDHLQEDRIVVDDENGSVQGFGYPMTSFLRVAIRQSP